MFNFIAELVIPIGIPSEEVKVEIDIHLVILEAKIRKCSICFIVVQTFFVVSTHQFILLSFFNEIISCFIDIFQSKFLTYLFSNHIFKITVYFQFHQELLISWLIALLEKKFIFSFTLTANNRKK